MSQGMFRLRPYQSTDEEAAIALWQRGWQQAYPNIDFAQRVDWFREHWANLQLDSRIVLAEFALPPHKLADFVAVSPRTGYLDQIVVAPEAQRLQAGQLLVEAAKRVGREGLYLHVNKDNDARARLLPEMRLRDRGRGRQSQVRRAGLHDDLAAGQPQPSP